MAEIEQCPYCGKELHGIGYEYCPFCGEWFMRAYSPVLTVDRMVAV